MTIDFLLDRFVAKGEADAFVYLDNVYTYSWLHAAIAKWHELLKRQHIASHSVVALKSDFSHQSTALLLALINNRNIIVPLSPAVTSRETAYLHIAQVEKYISLTDGSSPVFKHLDNQVNHPLLCKLKHSGHAGLVLFSSGSTGKSKASVHNFAPLLAKFNRKRHIWRTIAFLLFDHIGGVNTLFYTLSNTGCMITVSNRDPDAVCRAIEKHQVELLPTSPTFLNLMLLSEAYKRHDLSSLKIITYGTEIMPQSTLRALHRILPGVRLKQTYGLSELGILRSKSKSSDSLWVKVGGEDFKTKVVDGILWIKAQSAMLGYLNANDPFTEDGWFNTKDAVEVDGEYLRFLGRTSDIINVGGEKVYPAEVESVIQSMENVKHVLVFGEPNAITGNIVVAEITPKTAVSSKALSAEVKRFCRERLPKFKVPVKVFLSDQELRTERFKKKRKRSPD